MSNRHPAVFRVFSSIYSFLLLYAAAAEAARSAFSFVQLLHYLEVSYRHNRQHSLRDPVSLADEIGVAVHFPIYFNRLVADVHTRFAALARRCADIVDQDAYFPAVAADQQYLERC